MGEKLTLKQVSLLLVDFGKIDLEKFNELKEKYRKKNRNNDHIEAFPIPPSAKKKRSALVKKNGTKTMPIDDQNEEEREIAEILLTLPYNLKKCSGHEKEKRMQELLRVAEEESIAIKRKENGESESPAQENSRMVNNNNGSSNAKKWRTDSSVHEPNTPPRMPIDDQKQREQKSAKKPVRVPYNEKETGMQEKGESLKTVDEEAITRISRTMIDLAKANNNVSNGNKRESDSSVEGPIIPPPMPQKLREIEDLDY